MFSNYLNEFRLRMVINHLPSIFIRVLHKDIYDVGIKFLKLSKSKIHVLFKNYLKKLLSIQSYHKIIIKLIYYLSINPIRHLVHLNSQRVLL